MSDVIAWFMANWGLIITTLLAVIGGASIMVKAIAPLTRSDSDDKLVSFLEKVQAWLAKLALNTPSNKAGVDSAPETVDEAKLNKKKSTKK